MVFEPGRAEEALCSLSFHGWWAGLREYRFASRYVVFPNVDGNVDGLEFHISEEKEVGAKASSGS